MNESLSHPEEEVIDGKDGFLLADKIEFRELIFQVLLLFVDELDSLRNPKNLLKRTSRVL
jgi:hypothetical protein